MKKPIHIKPVEIEPWIYEFYEGGYNTQAMRDTLGDMPGAKARLLAEIEELREQRTLEEAAHQREILINETELRALGIEKNSQAFADFQLAMQELNNNRGCDSLIGLFIGDRERY